MRVTGEAVDAVRAWIETNVPRAWVDAGREGGAAAVRIVRTRAEYEQWYPVFAGSGLVAPTWPVEYGGLDLPVSLARRIEQELAPFNLGRLNPLGLNLCAPALFAHGSEAQRLRYLPRDRAQRRSVVPALQRADCGLRPGIARDAGRARR